MATIYIDNTPHQVPDGVNLLHACLGLGLDLPYFCWHPAMHSVGACRQCAVKQFKDEHDTKGRIVMACMTPAAEGTRISIDDPDVRLFRKSVIEWLMVNHPHDCPVCDEGGECHLQDMTVMTGHDYRRYRFTKRTYRNQELGPFVTHEMNRCIQCYRCVRFYRDTAGGRDFNVLGWHDHVYFGRSSDGALESPFAGNLVEVCPTGVFTDKSLCQHYTRKWDLQNAPSVCVHCSLGCNTIPGERYGQLRRIRNRYNRDVNGYFLCDRGRYGYEFVNSDRRIKTPLWRASDGQLATCSSEEALAKLAEMVGDGSRVIGIGSPRASLEANYALLKLVGPERFCCGLSDHAARLTRAALEAMRSSPARTPSQQELAEDDAVLVLGEDILNTAPMLALSLRRAVLRQPMRILPELHIESWDAYSSLEAVAGEKGPVYIAAPHATALDDLARKTYHAPPPDLARWALAVAHEIDPAAPGVDGLAPAALELAREIANELRNSDRPAIVSGVSCGSEDVIHAAAAIAGALCRTGKPAHLSMILPECDSMGVAMLREVATGNRQPATGEEDRQQATGNRQQASDDSGQGIGVNAATTAMGLSLSDAASAITNGQADTVIVLENDLSRRADTAIVQAILSARHVVVLDHLENATTARAELVLPAATFAEGDGTLVNHEGRAQRFYRVMPSPEEVRESWRWLRDIAVAAGRLPAEAWANLDEIIAAMAADVPALAGVVNAAPPADFRMVGRKIPRQPHRYSGRTAMTADVNVNEPQPPEDRDSPLTFSMEGFDGQPPAALASNFWVPGWNSIQSITRFQEEVNGPLRGGPAGVRLIEPAPEASTSYPQPPPPFQQRDGQWLVVPAWCVFGSEELSALAVGVAQVSPQPYIGLAPSDIEKLGLAAGGTATVEISGKTLQLSVKSVPTIPQGLAAVPVGLPGIPYLELPSWSVIRK